MKRITPEQIRAARALLNMTQAEFSKVCGLSVPAIQGIECGRVAARTNTLDRITERLFALDVHFINTQRLEKVVVGVARVLTVEVVDKELIDPRRRSIDELGEMYAKLKAGGDEKQIKQFIQQLKGEDEANEDLIDLLEAMLGENGR